MNIKVKIVTVGHLIQRAANRNPSGGEYRKFRQQMLRERHVGGPISVSRLRFNSRPPQFTVDQ